MKDKIVHSPLGITVLGAGKAKRKQLCRALELAPCLVAADGGAVTALKLGLRPSAVIGDMDSAPELARLAPDMRIHRIPEQESTDFAKCLRNLSAPFVLALGVAGPRLDHGLAALNALTRAREMPVIIVSGDDLVFHCPPRLRLELPVGTRLSLFPLAPLTGRSSGLEWPLDGIELSPMGRIGTSNRTTAPAVRLEFDAPGMLVLLPWRHLPQAIAALRD